MQETTKRGQYYKHGRKVIPQRLIRDTSYINGNLYCTLVLHSENLELVVDFNFVGNKLVLRTDLQVSENNILCV